MIFNNSQILSPQMLWKQFDSSLPLKPTFLTEDIIDGIEAKSVYFSGRDTAKGRVRIFGYYAYKKTTSRNKAVGALLILPDCSQTINREIVLEYANQGYAVLMIDYRGISDSSDCFTQYPQPIEYANYNKCGRHLDYADTSAQETCWYEWVACARYAVSFLQEQSGVSKIGILGIKEGANVAFMTAGCDNRISCLIPLFGAGWRAYKGVSKNSGQEIEMNEERMRFIAGVEVQAYAQNITCPVFYMTATNSPDFDIDRSVDTLLRIAGNNKVANDKDIVRYVNYAPRLRNCLDEYCKKDIELFLSKYLKNDTVYFPSEPKIEVNVEDKNVKCKVIAEFSDRARFKNVKVFISEGIENHAWRDWNEMQEIKSKIESEKDFYYELNGNSSFINVFARVEYKGGITLCSMVASKKIKQIDTRDNKLIYSTKKGLSSFTIIDTKLNPQFGLFINTDRSLELVDGAGILGITSKYGLMTYKTNKTFIRLNERSMFMTDIYSNVYSNIIITITALDSNNNPNDYVAYCSVSGAEVWQNILLKCTEFKSKVGLSIKDYSLVSAVKIEYDGVVLFNNILFI